MKSKLIAVSLIRSNILNPNEMAPDQYAKLKRHITKTEQYPSLVILKRDDGYVLLDGHNRLQILKELDHKEVWCEIWQLDDKSANLVLSTLNRLHGTDDTTKRVRLIKELNEQYEGDKELLLRLLPESERSLATLLKMADKDLDDIVDSLDDERDIIEGELVDKYGPEEAERMAKKYKYQGDGKPRLIFVFEDETDYYIAMKHFGKEPDVEKLISLITTKHGRKTDSQGKKENVK